MKLYYGMEKSPYPGPSQQKAAYLRSHDVHVVKSLTDGHREVIGHHGEKDDAHSTKEVLSEELDHAAFQGDGSALREGVYDQLGKKVEQAAHAAWGQRSRSALFPCP